jgi:hypothetical protein
LAGQLPRKLVRWWFGGVQGDRKRERAPKINIKKERKKPL